MDGGGSKVDEYLSALSEQALFKDAKTPASILWYIDFY
jgi:hypothetical protein